jgi:DNA-binding transcriptional ArsR family regulator
MKDLEKNLKALANRRRLAILRYLKNRREASVKQIASEINLSIKATSKHLGILLLVDMVEKEQRSLNVFYRIASKLKPEAKRIIELL